MPVLELLVGRTPWSLEFRVDPQYLPHQPIQSIADVRSAVNLALEHPIRFEPFRRALTPDDRIALLVDESLPQLTSLISGVLEYLNSAGIPTESVTALSPAGSSQSWINELPDAFSDLRTEVHVPDDRKRLSYLAATQNNARIYLNRTIVDADQTIVLSRRGYDPLLGYSGAEGFVFPRFSDVDQGNFVQKISPQQDIDHAWPIKEMATEVAWLMGLPFFVHVIEAEADQISAILAGTTVSSVEAIQHLNQRWRNRIAKRPAGVIVTLSGDPERHDFAALARAAACGARVVQPNGPVIILSEADVTLNDAEEILRKYDDPPDAVKQIYKKRPLDATAAVQWAWAAGVAKLYLASEIRPDTVEEMFATPLASPRDVQRLIDSTADWLIIPDGHQRWVDVNS